jgi:hypothetical protein
MKSDKKKKKKQKENIRKLEGFASRAATFPAKSS